MVFAEVLRACQVAGAESMQMLAEVYQSAAELNTITWKKEPVPVLSGPARTCVLYFGKQVASSAKDRKKIHEGPAIRIDLPRNLHRFGVDFLEEPVSPPLDEVNSVAAAKERNIRLQAKHRKRHEAP